MVEEKAVCKLFEQEMWLYITEELPENRMTFWKEHLLDCHSCMYELEESLKAVAKINHNSLFDIDDLLFDEMINRSVLVKKGSLKNIFKRSAYSENKKFYGKAALVGSLATAAIVISLITHQSIPNPAKGIPKELLDWEGKEITSQIDEMNKKIEMINEDKWNKEIILIDQKMDKLEKESDKFSFN